MKIRTDFVTNSSSSSFVVSKKDIGAKNTKYILDNFVHIDKDKLYEMWANSTLSDVYYLVDYAPSDEFMHVWVTRDECMYGGDIDAVLYNFNRSDISPIFDY